MKIIRRGLYGLLPVILFVMMGFVGATFDDPRISLIDYSTRCDIVLTGMASEITRSGLLEVRVNGFNTSHSYRRLEYLVEWYDTNNMKIDTIMSQWTKAPAFQESSFTLQAIAPNERACDFRILIRKGE